MSIEAPYARVGCEGLTYRVRCGKATRLFRMKASG